jgi:hypothetical protein
MRIKRFSNSTKKKVCQEDFTTDADLSLPTAKFHVHVSATTEHHEACNCQATFFKAPRRTDKLIK